jgi:serine/threonine protein kinase
MIEPQIENIKNYKILNLIGEGSFGKVFRAADRNNDNIVALKILSKVSEFNEILNKNKNFIKIFLFTERTIIKRFSFIKTRI